MRQNTDVFERLEAGNARHLAGTSETTPPTAAARAAMAKGQSPFAIVLSCADSRVVPEHIFDTGPGELFVLRVAGNVANTSTIASIEYAVAHLGTPVILVLGHEGCGAIQAAIDSLAGVDNGYNLNHLLSHIRPAQAACDEGSVESIVKKNAEMTATALVDRSQIMRDAKSEGRLELAAAYYEIGSGKVTFVC